MAKTFNGSNLGRGAIMRRQAAQLAATGLFGFTMAGHVAGRGAGRQRRDRRPAGKGRPGRGASHRAAQPLSAHGPRVFRRPSPPGGTSRPESQGGLEDQGRRREVRRAVREKIRRWFGPLPEKTPLKPRITGVVERDAYTIEKVIFESRPEFLVTANLYVPRAASSRLPGVVGTCGHSHNGKAAEAYQSFAQGLARMGYVVLIYDPLGQGERLQYREREARVPDRRRRAGAPLRRQPAVPGRRVPRHLAGVGRHPCPGLPADPGGSRSAARGRHRQLGRRHA